MSDTDPRQQRMMQAFTRFVPHVAALGMIYVGHGSDWAELSLPPAPELVGYPDVGIVANGAVFSLIDSCAGMAVFARRGDLAHATLDLRLDYVGAPAVGATVTARMTCYRLTRTVAFVRGIAHTGDPERPIANATGTFMFVAPKS